jgi:hypothetical protein
MAYFASSVRVFASLLFNLYSVQKDVSPLVLALHHLLRAAMMSLTDVVTRDGDNVHTFARLWEEES